MDGRVMIVHGLVELLMEMLIQTRFTAIVVTQTLLLMVVRLPGVWIYKDFTYCPG